MPRGIYERPTVKERFEDKIYYSIDGCWYWTGAQFTTGYGSFNDYKGRKTYVASRLSYELYRGKIPDGFYVCHSCDNRLCVNPDHLWLGTNDENMADMVRKNRQVKGEHSGRSKLTESDVMLIRSSKEPNPELGRKYNVTASTICDIKHKKIWKHLQ